MNIQAQGDITVGLTHSETRQVVMDVFEANFIRLRDEAAELVWERAEFFLKSFLEEAAREGLTTIPEGRNPDFQAALYSAQREYARSGDEDLGELLVQLLVDRSKVQERDLEQIALNESLAVASKLTQDQLDALSLVFILKYTQSELESLADLHEHLNQFILPFVAGASRKRSAYQHLEYAGCGAISALQSGGYEIFTERYGGLFCEGFTEEELRAAGLTDEQESELIIRCLHSEERLQVRALNQAELEAARIGSLLFIFADSPSYQIGSPSPIDTFATRLSAQALRRYVRRTPRRTRKDHTVEAVTSPKDYGSRTGTSLPNGCSASDGRFFSVVGQRDPNKVHDAYERGHRYRSRQHQAANGRRLRSHTVDVGLALPQRQLHLRLPAAHRGAELQPGTVCRFGDFLRRTNCPTRPRCVRCGRRRGCGPSWGERGARTSRTPRAAAPAVYFAKPIGPAKIRDEKVGWYGPEDWDGMRVNAEVRGWCERALAVLGVA